MQLVEVTSLHVSGLFNGMCTEGLFVRFLVFVKCMSSFLT